MKKIVFLTGTRADFGKLKPLMKTVNETSEFDLYIYVTGMHMNSKYGKTVDEVQKCGFKNIFQYYNHLDGDSMDSVLANTINGFSNYIKDVNPDMIVLHGDRPETLAGAIVGSFNNIRTAHIEGGEVSGTIDDSIRHAVSKLCHIHFVANEDAKKRLMQMGEDETSIFIIGSPDVDIMLSDKLPSIEETKERYNIPFDRYAILIFHPVTTEYEHMNSYSENVVDAVIESKLNYIVIQSNNDKGSEFIFEKYKNFITNSRIKVFPSIRFEYFLSLLKNSEFIIGNSSAGIREAPYYGVPVLNIGNRQENRSQHTSAIANCGYDKDIILSYIRTVPNKYEVYNQNAFGEGNSVDLFYKILMNMRYSSSIWTINKQKHFKNI